MSQHVHGHQLEHLIVRSCSFCMKPTSYYMECSIFRTLNKLQLHFTNMSMPCTIRGERYVSQFARRTEISTIVMASWAGECGQINQRPVLIVTWENSVFCKAHCISLWKGHRSYLCMYEVVH